MEKSESLTDLKEQKIIVQNQIKDLIIAYEKLFGVEITLVELVSVQSNFDKSSQLVKVNLSLRIND